MRASSSVQMRSKGKCDFVLSGYIFMAAVMTAMLESENIAEG